MYDVPTEPPPQTMFFKAMKEADELYKKFQPFYKKYMKQIDNIIVEMILKLDEMSKDHSLKGLDVVTAVMVLDKLLTEIYRDIAGGRFLVIRKVLGKLGFKLTI